MHVPAGPDPLSSVEAVGAPEQGDWAQAPAAELDPDDADADRPEGHGPASTMTPRRRTAPPERLRPERRHGPVVR
jgi:hypothetical protein